MGSNKKLWLNSFAGGYDVSSIGNRRSCRYTKAGIVELQESEMACVSSLYHEFGALQKILMDAKYPTLYCTFKKVLA